MSLRTILLSAAFTLAYLFICVYTSVTFIETEETLKLIYAIAAFVLALNIIALDTIEPLLTVKYLDQWDRVFVDTKRNKLVLFSIAANIATGFDLLIFTQFMQAV